MYEYVYIFLFRRIMVGVIALIDLYYCQKNCLIFFLFVRMYLFRFFLLLVFTLAFQ
jgi:hypothetical protein